MPAEERSDAVSAVADDPREVIATWARLSAEVGQRAAPVLALVRAAAAADPEAAALLAEIDAGRLARMRHNAEALARRGHLRPGLSVERAAQLMVAISGSLHDPLVGDAGWSAVEYSEVVERLLTAALLADARRGPHPLSQGVRAPVRSSAQAGTLATPAGRNRRP